jgi:hypothetical protein
VCPSLNVNAAYAPRFDSRTEMFTMLPAPEISDRPKLTLTRYVCRVVHAAVGVLYLSGRDDGGHTD